MRIFLPHNNTSRHLPGTPCRSYCPSGPEAVEHKPLEAEAAADSQADHHSPGTTAEAAEAAEGSNLDQAVPLEGDNIAAVVDLDRSKLCWT